MSLPAQQQPQLRSPGDRQEILAGAVNSGIRDGYRVESHTATQVILVKGRRPNHVLHLILTLVTFGLWLFVWIPLAMFGGERRKVLTVDPYGYVQIHKGHG